MEEETFDEEFSMMYEEPQRVKTLNSDTFRMPVKHLKVRRPVSLDRRQTVQEALTLMQAKQSGCVLVTEGDALAGILTERDIVLKGIGQRLDLARTKVEEIMTPDPETVQSEDSIALVMNAMHVGGYRHVPVVDEDDVPVAVVSIKDIINFIVENFSEEILNLPPHRLRHNDTQDGG